MLLFVDLARDAVLLAVDLTALLRSQLATVGGAIVVDFAVDARFFVLEV